MKKKLYKKIIFLIFLTILIVGCTSKIDAIPEGTYVNNVENTNDSVKLSIKENTFKLWISGNFVADGTLEKLDDTIYELTSNTSKMFFSYNPIFLKYDNEELSFFSICSLIECSPDEEKIYTKKDYPSIEELKEYTPLETQMLKKAEE